MKKKFDLTTVDGKEIIKNFLMFTNPTLMMVSLLKELFKSKNVDEQSKIADALIRKGKDEGLEEMEIVLNNSKGGFKFSAPIEGVDISAEMSLPNDKVLIKVKYK